MFWLIFVLFLSFYVIVPYTKYTINPDLLDTSSFAVALRMSALPSILAFIFLAVVPLAWSDSHSSTGPIVKISQGSLEGIEGISRNGRKYNAFLGIPYGKAERWRHSELADRWEGVRQAGQFGSACVQYDVLISRKYEGSEDCLFLNVYSPKNASSDNPLPVMVFIHGGGWQAGTGSLYGAKYFMDQDVVLVTINYRVGPFGFVDTGSGANFGLVDQVLALEWVQENINAFGGDKSSVTIFGESAGAMSVSYHLLSPLSKDLFHRGISESGAANSPFNNNPESKNEFKKLGALLNCPTTDQKEMIECLGKIDGIELLPKIEAAKKLPDFNPEDDPKFLPSVDATSNLEHGVFLPDKPINLLQNGEFNSIPWITGVNAFEGNLFPSDMKIATYKTWGIKDATTISYDTKDTKGLTAIRDFYVGDSEDQETVAANVSNLFSDRTFIHPGKVSAILHAKKAPTYLYYFNARGKHSIIDAANPPGRDGLRAPTHADELQYLFNTTVFPEIKDGSEFIDFSETMVKIWASFARDGTVAPEKLSPKFMPWTPVSNDVDAKDYIEWYEIGTTEFKMMPEKSIVGSRLTFWENFLPKRSQEEGRPIE